MIYRHARASDGDGEVVARSVDVELVTTWWDSLHSLGRGIVLLPCRLRRHPLAWRVHSERVIEADVEEVDEQVHIIEASIIVMRQVCVRCTAGPS